MVFEYSMSYSREAITIAASYQSLLEITAIEPSLSPATGTAFEIEVGWTT